MQYPQFLKEKDTIGITALSDGITDPIRLKRLDHSLANFQERGLYTLETKDVRKSKKGRSADAKTRAEEFHSLLKDSKVKAILCATGGEFLIETLPFIDFELIRKNPKWIQGYSDPTGILFTVTTKLDIATIYSNNAGAFGMEPWHSSIQNNFALWMGKDLIQASFPKYEKESIPYQTGLEGYHLDTCVKWRNLWQKEIFLEGRLIGGCLDILSELAGTPYDYTKSFIQKYKEDGIIWFFDNCELSGEDLIRTFWKLEVCGWFQSCKGILLGRSATDTSYFQISFQETLVDALKHLNVPVIYDMDFGHVPPRMTLINGGYIHLHSKDGKGEIQFEYK